MVVVTKTADQRARIWRSRVRVHQHARGCSSFSVAYNSVILVCKMEANEIGIVTSSVNRTPKPANDKVFTGFHPRWTRNRDGKAQ